MLVERKKESGMRKSPDKGERLKITDKKVKEKDINEGWKTKASVGKGRREWDERNGNKNECERLKRAKKKR